MAQRAKMSDRTARQELYLAYPLPGWATADDEAEHEARAILAETEAVALPDSGRSDAAGFPSASYMSVRGLRVSVWQAAPALADALACFLGQTFAGERCHCAQGIHWSAERGEYRCDGIVPSL